eukprot:765512-Hanusia_phi.AAC.3
MYPLIIKGTPFNPRIPARAAPHPPTFSLIPLIALLRAPSSPDSFPGSPPMVWSHRGEGERGEGRRRRMRRRRGGIKNQRADNSDNQLIVMEARALPWLKLGAVCIETTLPVRTSSSRCKRRPG